MRVETEKECRREGRREGGREREKEPEDRTSGYDRKGRGTGELNGRNDRGEAGIKNTTDGAEFDRGLSPTWTMSLVVKQFSRTDEVGRGNKGTQGDKDTRECKLEVQTQDSGQGTVSGIFSLSFVSKMETKDSGGGSLEGYPEDVSFPRSR